MPGLEQMPRDELIVLAGEQADRLAAQDRQITALAAQVADLMEANEQLTAKLERLKHLLSRNSGFSELRVRGRLDGLAASSVRRRA